MNPEFMKEAIRLSIDNIESMRGGPFGAVIVKDGKVIARASNEVSFTNDPTAHAEVVAIRKACKKLCTFDLSGCEIYTSCEPCPMCLSAIYWAKITIVYYANTKDDAAAINFNDAFIYEELGKEKEERTLKTIQLMRDEAQKAFVLWEAFEAKIRY
jgi:guanine deaminase